MALKGCYNIALNKNRIGLIMNEESTEADLSMWFSTYGLLTSKRILDRFNIKLETDQLIAAIKNPQSIYYQLLLVPIKNVFNGIILQQAHDYQVYAQKLFIDYLLSGEASKAKELPGANTREDMDLERNKLLEITEEFHQQEITHQKLIAQSQASLIKLSNELKNKLQAASKRIAQALKISDIVKEEELIQQAIRSSIIHYSHVEGDILSVSSSFWTKLGEMLDADLDKAMRQELADILVEFGDPRKDVAQIIDTYLEQTDDMSLQLRSFRSQLYDLILRVTEFIKFLPDYRVDEMQKIENRSSLYFDAHIGEN